MKYLIPLFVVLLAGCSAHEITDNDISASSQMETAKSACYAAVAAQASADADMIKSVKQSDRTMMTMVYLNNKNTNALISAITGNSIDKCAGSNLFDYLIAETEAKNKALATGLGHAVTGLKWIAGAWTVSEVAGQIGDTYKSEGMSTTSVTNQAESGNTATSQKDSGNTFTTSPIDSTVNTVENP